MPIITKKTNSLFRRITRHVEVDSDKRRKGFERSPKPRVAGSIPAAPAITMRLLRFDVVTIGLNSNILLTAQTTAPDEPHLRHRNWHLQHLEVCDLYHKYAIKGDRSSGAIKG